MKGLIGKYVNNIVVVGSQWGDVEGKEKLLITHQKMLMLL